MKLKKIGIQFLTYFLVLGAFTAATYWGSRAVSVVAQMIPLERDHTIIVDAGHGGEDGGATSCTGKLESAFNLEIALKLDDLMHLLGYDTVMIRTTDRSVYTQGDTIAAKKVSDLKERVRIVNETENAILISIHQNIFPDSRYDGAQVFYAPTEGSQELAQAMQPILCTARKCKSGDSVYLLQNIDTTGILVECGFLSNPEEEAKLREPGYQQLLCGKIVSALSGYLKTKD